MKPLIRIGLTVVWLGASLSVSAAIVVPGTANPNLAGRASGYLCCSGDSTPAHAPVLVTGVPFAAGDRLTFSVTGTTLNTPGASTGVVPGAPDGGSTLGMTNYGDGISAPLSVRLNALMGVFLGAASPTGGATPAQLDFSGGSGLAFTTLSPLVGQIFFIGDGRTTLNAGPSAGAAQEFVVPAGATRLFLGSSDGFGWFNNSGDFRVDVVGAIPLPAAAWLLLGGLGVLGGFARRRATD